MSKQLDLRGQSFGFWTVMNEPPIKYSNGQTAWLCLCACGTNKYVTLNSLRSCNSTSCGCRKRVPKTDIENEFRIICKQIKVAKSGDRRELLKQAALILTRKNENKLCVILEEELFVNCHNQ